MDIKKCQIGVRHWKFKTIPLDALCVVMLHHISPNLSHVYINFSDFKLTTSIRCKSNVNVVKMKVTRRRWHEEKKSVFEHFFYFCLLVFYSTNCTVLVYGTGSWKQHSVNFYFLIKHEFLVCRFVVG